MTTQEVLVCGSSFLYVALLTFSNKFIFQTRVDIYLPLCISGELKHKHVVYWKFFPIIWFVALVKLQIFVSQRFKIHESGHDKSMRIIATVVSKENLLIEMNETTVFYIVFFYQHSFDVSFFNYLFKFWHHCLVADELV